MTEIVSIQHNAFILHSTLRILDWPWPAVGGSLYCTKRTGKAPLAEHRKI